MSDKKKSFLKKTKLILPIVLAVFFGWLTFSKLPITEIIPYFKSANYWWIALGLVLGVLSHLSRAYRWNYLLKPMGYSIKTPNSIMAIFIAYLANYGVPRSGEVLRAAVATNYENIPFEKSFGTIVTERICDLIMMLSICVITLFFQFDFIYNILIKKINLSNLIIILLGLCLLFGLVVFYIKKSKGKIANKIKSFVVGLLEGITSIYKMKNKGVFIFHTIFIWLMYILMFYITSLSLKELHGAPFASMIVAFIAASFTIATTNGGVFFYPAAVLSALTLFGLAEEPSYAFGWIIWTSQTMIIIVIGVLSFIFLPIYNKNRIRLNK
ncbi:flippase-like domain-containing protein [Lacinutrix sp. C3R15]|uniref:lysylphosphatidylglycerol synthase transmembrane domain-containing protein n=1 Tax=Flavobacteriaceae TaxID=49546 RepID=UPI001C09507D|nr:MULTISPECIES: lysylphosphatidylglycerol synthase transmembrane domain-containing protein [Flavobacteriaceae]MBU2938052.1 flippase-like domain-containing protein [Lacinutrix sp. C3R15]MDO6621366.1 lysylphosphatidylglycerol synthase transmembrane domain-containing protein [Oceanihabitans sp. 1_MG-2023]